MREQNTPLVTQKFVEIDIAVCRLGLEIRCFIRRTSASSPPVHRLEKTHLWIQEGVAVALLLAWLNNDGIVGQRAFVGIL